MPGAPPVGDRGPQGDLQHQRDRVAQRPLSTRRQSPLAFPERHGRTEVPLQSSRPHRARKGTLGNEMEARAKRSRDSVRRKNQLNPPSQIHRESDTPQPGVMLRIGSYDWKLPFTLESSPSGYSIVVVELFGGDVDGVAVAGGVGVVGLSGGDFDEEGVVAGCVLELVFDVEVAGVVGAWVADGLPVSEVVHE